MTSERDDSRLVEYLYGELSADEARAFEDGDPSALDEARELGGVLSMAREADPPLDPPAFLDAKILAAARQAADAATEAQASRGWRRWLTGSRLGGVLAATAAGLLVVMNLPFLDRSASLHSPERAMVAPAAPAAQAASGARAQDTAAMPSAMGGELDADDARSELRKLEEVAEASREKSDKQAERRGTRNDTLGDGLFAEREKGGAVTGADVAEGRGGGALGGLAGKTARQGAARDDDRPQDVPPAEALNEAKPEAKAKKELGWPDAPADKPAPRAEVASAEPPPPPPVAPAAPAPVVAAPDPSSRGPAARRPARPPASAAEKAMDELVESKSAEAEAQAEVAQAARAADDAEADRRTRATAKDTASSPPSADRAATAAPGGGAGASVGSVAATGDGAAPAKAKTPVADDAPRRAEAAAILTEADTLIRAGNVARAEQVLIGGRARHLNTRPGAWLSLKLGELLERQDRAREAQNYAREAIAWSGDDAATRSKATALLRRIQSK